MLNKISNVKNLFINSKINSKIISQFKFIKFSQFNFARKKAKGVMEDILTQDSQAIDHSDLSSEVKQREDFKIGVIPEVVKTGEIKLGYEEKKVTSTTSSDRITSKILCDLIGTKHYPANEEIVMDRDSIVSVFDENDKMLGQMSLSQALENASALNKDIVVRNDKVRPPIVKMMKYRVELVKRLFKKIGKNLGKDLSQSEEVKKKLMGFSLKMDPNDFDSKVDKLRQLLAENNYVKIVIPVDLDNPEQVLKATQILKNAASEVTQLGKIRSGPIKQRKKSERVRSQDPSIDASPDEFKKHDKIIKDAYERSQDSYVETEKDFDFVDSIYFELESLIVDTTGIDYEKLLQSTNIDALVRGITHTNVIGEVRSMSDEMNRPISKDMFTDKLSKGISQFSGIGISTPLKKQLEVLEKEAVVQHDYGKRLEIQNRIDLTESDLAMTEMRYHSKILKLKMINLSKRSAEKAGLLEKNKA